jgi:putative transposase
MTSKRRLPHIYPNGCWLFLTWALHGSLPASHFPPARKVVDDGAGVARSAGEAGADGAASAAGAGVARSAGEAFAWIDRYLDGAGTGPVYLRQESIAMLVIESLFRGETMRHYRLGPFVIMANHVHVLLLPSISPSLLLKSLKGATAREANRALGRTGEQFWQRETFDHWVRSDTEWTRIADYIERNPVKAGLVTKMEEYPWSSANARWSGSVHRSVNAARKSACATSDTSACATNATIRILA